MDDRLAGFVVNWENLYHYSLRYLGKLSYASFSVPACPGLSFFTFKHIWWLCI